MSHIQAYNLRALRAAKNSEHRTLFQRIFREANVNLSRTIPEDTVKRWMASGSDLGESCDHRLLLDSVAKQNVILTVPGRLYNHDLFVVYRCGNVYAKVLYFSSLIVIVCVSLLAMYVYHWLGCIACFVAVYGASANGNLVDGILPQMALLAGLISTFFGADAFAATCSMCWVIWLVGSYASALSYEISCDLIYCSAAGFQWLYSRGKVTVISSKSET
jgi:hypothetical protein